MSDPSSGVDPAAAVIVETVQGEGGLNVADYAWLRRVADIARKHGALLIVDDIQAGIGRTGTFFSFEPAGLKPDIVTMAKSLSGYGLPMALVLLDRRYDKWLPGEHNGTFRGNCHAFVTARVALEEFWRDKSFESAIYDKGELLKQRLAEIADSNGGDRIRTKGRGMMRGLEMPSGEIAAKVVRIAFERGLVIETSGPHDEVVKCLTALTITDDELNQGLDILANSVRHVFAKADRAAA
jgi:diaminobutyrate-2-oxoglutarate transaminase